LQYKPHRKHNVFNVLAFEEDKRYNPLSPKENLVQHVVKTMGNLFQKFE
jgi:hypothetical protein